MIFGETGLFGIRTMQKNVSPDLGLIILNSGMLPCMGPYRMNVQLADKLAGKRIATIRLDQSGKGESPVRENLSHSDAALVDYDEAQSSLHKLGVRKMILMGICSGAADALRIAAQRDSVAGVVLIDGYVERSMRWHLHRAAWVASRSVEVGPRELMQRILGNLRRESGTAFTGLRNELQFLRSLNLRHDYERVLGRGATMLSIFSGDFWPYNHHGQLRHYLTPGINLMSFTEVFLKEADHTYTLAEHRNTLLSIILNWLDNEFAAIETRSES